MNSTYFRIAKTSLGGQQWENRIIESIDSVTFLVPIITPAFFKSEPCRKELLRFIERERRLKRNDLILPIHYIDTPLLAEPRDDELASVITSRQYADWRAHRHDPTVLPEVKKMLDRLAKQVVVALAERIIASGGVAEIAMRFKERMDEFNAIDAGASKYLDLGAEVYRSVATSLDECMNAEKMSSDDEAFVRGISRRLKHLADYPSDYLAKNSFSKLWNDGTRLCDELLKRAGTPSLTMLAAEPTFHMTTGKKSQMIDAFKKKCDHKDGRIISRGPTG